MKDYFDFNKTPFPKLLYFAPLSFLCRDSSPLPLLFQGVKRFALRRRRGPISLLPLQGLGFLGFGLAKQTGCESSISRLGNLSPRGLDGPDCEVLVEAVIEITVFCVASVRFEEAVLEGFERLLEVEGLFK